MADTSPQRALLYNFLKKFKPLAKLLVIIRKLKVVRQLKKKSCLPKLVSNKQAEVSQHENS